MTHPRITPQATKDCRHRLYASATLGKILYRLCGRTTKMEQPEYAATHSDTLPI